MPKNEAKMKRKLQSVPSNGTAFSSPFCSNGIMQKPNKLWDCKLRFCFVRNSGVMGQLYGLCCLFLRGEEVEQSCLIQPWKSVFNCWWWRWSCCSSCLNFSSGITPASTVLLHKHNENIQYFGMINFCMINFWASGQKENGAKQQTAKLFTH